MSSTAVYIQAINTFENKVDHTLKTERLILSEENQAKKERKKQQQQNTMAQISKIFRNLRK